jgi:sRNA-binding carbon storage regulator CsrA
MNAEKTTRIISDLRIGERLKIGDAVVTLMEKSGRMARLMVNTPESVKVEINRAKNHEYRQSAA